jgi:hypothetical protein
MERRGCLWKGGKACGGAGRPAEGRGGRVFLRPLPPAELPGFACAASPTWRIAAGGMGAAFRRLKRETPRNPLESSARAGRSAAAFRPALRLQGLPARALGQSRSGRGRIAPLGPRRGALPGATSARGRAALVRPADFPLRAKRPEACWGGRQAPPRSGKPLGRPRRLRLSPRGPRQGFPGPPCRFPGTARRPAPPQGAVSRLRHGRAHERRKGRAHERRKGPGA